MIEVKEVTKRFGDHVSVNHAKWTAEDGQITGFIGPNGAGKTTTLKMITGLLKPDEGSVTVNGLDIQQEPFKVKEQYGYVSDTPDHFLALKGIEYLNFMADVFGIPSSEAAAFVEKTAVKFGMQDALDRPILTYSHGMRQKIMVMGALIHRPKVWILDEPLTGLDPQAAFELKKMMREHADAGNSVLFSTHVLEVAEKLCDKVVIIRKGEIQFEGTLEELKARFGRDESLEDIFLKVTGDNNE